MMLASIWTGKEVIRAFVTEEQQATIQQNRNSTRLIRDFHGYGNDYLLEARLISFQDIPLEHWYILKLYINMIESYSEEMEYLISDIENFEEREKILNEPD